LRPLAPPGRGLAIARTKLKKPRIHFSGALAFLAAASPSGNTGYGIVTGLGTCATTCADDGQNSASSRREFPHGKTRATIEQLEEEVTVVRSLDPARLDEAEDLHPDLHPDLRAVIDDRLILDDHAAACFRARPSSKCAPARCA
jgi:hypothetical protein